MKHYLIIGGATGIGHALLELLNAKAYHTVSINRNGNTIARERYACDIAKDILPILEIPIDGLIYMPGTIVLKPFKALTDEDFTRDWNINFMGAVRVIRNYLPLLTKSGNASIVLFSSVAVQTGMAFHSSIAAAKGAIEGYTRAMAAELAPTVRVNAIAPSLTLSPLSAKLTDSASKMTLSKERHPLKTIGNAEDIASMAAYLMSEQAAFITGQIIKIDGGLSSIR